MSQYEELDQIPAVKKYSLTDREKETFIQKAGEFEYQDFYTRPEAERLALALVLDGRANGRT